MTWTVPREWAGEPAFILGGGSSLDLIDIASLRGRGRIFAVNDAGLVRAPWADVLYFADAVKAKWLGWNRGELHRFEGKYVVTRMKRGVPINAGLVPAGVDLKILTWKKNLALSRSPDTLSGYCSGGNAINLAYLFGCDPIYLLGFDMRQGRWHNRHKRPERPHLYRERFIPAIERMAPELGRDGVKVFNGSPGSALTCFPFVDITLGQLAA